MAASNKLKKNLSAYQFFCSSAEVRKSIKEENPDIKPKEVMGKIGERWKALTEEGKKPFIDQAAEDKKRYQEELASLPPATEEETSSNKKKSDKKDKKKATPNGYQVFSKEIRPSIRSENPSLSLGEQSKVISERWKALSDEEKTAYKLKASEEAKSTEEEKEEEQPPAEEPAVAAPKEEEEAVATGGDKKGAKKTAKNKF